MSRGFLHLNQFIPSYWSLYASSPSPSHPPSVSFFFLFHLSLSLSLSLSAYIMPLSLSQV